MPASPLAAALLGGNENAAMMGVDPALMQSLPDIQLGQSLEQGSLSTAPAAPAQALARLAQALAGHVVKQGAISDLGRAMSGSADEMAKIFPAGTPLGDALRSPNPVVRMTAMQQAPKAMLLGTEPRDVAPGGQLYGGKNIIAENTRPRTGPGQTVEEALRLQGQGQPAAAEALTRTISKEGSTSTGVPYPSVPIAPRPTGAGASPSAAIQPPPTADQMNTAKDKLASKLNAATQAGVTAPSATGMSDQIAGAEAKIEQAKTGAEQTMKDYVEKSTPAYNSAQALKGRLDIIDHNISQLGPSWMGSGADTKAELGKAWNSTLDTMGVKGLHIDPAKIATWEDFTKETKRAGMELIKSNFGGSREAASIIQMGASAVPSVQNTYLGAKYVSSTIRAAAQREVDLHEYKTQLLNAGKSLVGADVNFSKEHPTQAYAMGAITSQIPPQAVAHLKSTPNLAPQFDKQFGPGTAEFLLGQK